MLRVLLTLIPVALTVFCLVDLAMSSRGEKVRLLPRWAWALVILLLPLLGSIGWLVAGRPSHKPEGGTQHPASRPDRPAPDDDPAFLNELERRRQQGQREELKKWQEELERRERELRPGNGSDEDGSGGTPHS